MIYPPAIFKGVTHELTFATAHEKAFFRRVSSRMQSQPPFLLTIWAVLMKAVLPQLYIDKETFFEVK
jgi:hypothetical protein